MTDRSTRREPAGSLSVAAVACAVLLRGAASRIGGLSIAGLASTTFIGMAGLAVAIVAAGGVVAIRRRHGGQRCDATSVDAVTLAAPTRKPSSR